MEMKHLRMVVALISLCIAAGTSNAVTVEELELRVNDLEKSTNKIIENVRKTNELINEVSDAVYIIERRQKKRKEREEDDDDSRSARRRHR